MKFYPFLNILRIGIAITFAIIVILLLLPLIRFTFNAFTNPNFFTITYYVEESANNVFNITLNITYNGDIVLQNVTLYIGNVSIKLDRLNPYTSIIKTVVLRFNSKEFNISKIPLMMKFSISNIYNIEFSIMPK